MGEMRKITVEVREELLESALASTDQGITQTVRRGLELVAAGRAYEELRLLRGKLRLGLELETLREDRAGDDTALVESALADHQACLPPVVRTELLSDPKLPRSVAALLSQLPLLDADPGFWERAGRLRAKLIARKRRARLAAALVSQSCIDRDVRLVTRDDDFHHFARLGGLRLAV